MNIVGKYSIWKNKRLVRWVFTRVNILKPAMPLIKSPKIKRKYELKGNMTQKGNKGQKTIIFNTSIPDLGVYNPLYLCFAILNFFLCLELRHQVLIICHGDVPSHHS